MMCGSVIKRLSFAPVTCLNQLKNFSLFVVGLSLAVVGTVNAQVQDAKHIQDIKIGFVNTERILQESAPAKAAQAKIKAEFKKRESDLQRLTNDFRLHAEKFDKDAPVLSETDRFKRQNSLRDLDTELQRKRREFQEDFNRRRNEEFSNIVQKANTAIKRIAEQEHYDFVLQDAVTVSPRVDITDKVIQTLK